MDNKDNIELLVWDYIDGNLSEEDTVVIATLIKNDNKWNAVYSELMCMHNELSEVTMLSEPHIRFTKNIMEQIATEQVSFAKKVYVNPKIIKGIAAIILFTICTSVVYILTNTNWSFSSGTSTFTDIVSLQIPNFNFESISGGTLINGMIGANVILAIALLDTFLSRKHINQS